MLASMLGDCGGEWFHPIVKERYLNLALGFTDPWRIFNGVVVHYHHAQRAIESLKQPYKVIHLVRQDEFARIMSLLAAHISGRWHERLDVEQEPREGTKHIVALKNIAPVVKFARDNERTALSLGMHTDLEVTYEDLVQGKGLDAVCTLLQRDLSDLKSPACTRSASYQDVIANVEEVEAYVKGELAK